MNLEGLVSKHRERRYRPRTCDWVKVKNRKHPAFSRESVLKREKPDMPDEIKRLIVVLKDLESFCRAAIRDLRRETVGRDTQ
jgi:hypothetical protein